MKRSELKEAIKEVMEDHEVTSIDFLKDLVEKLNDEFSLIDEDEDDEEELEDEE